MSLITFLIIIIIIVLLIWIVVAKIKIIKYKKYFSHSIDVDFDGGDINEEDDISAFYIYKEKEFPLNIYFDNDTRKNADFWTLYDGVKEAVRLFNDAFDFKFFAINENIEKYPNVVTIRLVCGIHNGCVSKFDGAGGILAHATYPPVRQVCVDCMDIQFGQLHLVMLHEFGHILGITHTREGPNVPLLSLMNPYIDDKLTGFTAYDILRIKRRFRFLK